MVGTESDQAPASVENDIRPAIGSIKCRHLSNSIKKVSPLRLKAIGGCRLFFFASALRFFSASLQVSLAQCDRNPLVETWLLVRYVDTPENREAIFVFGNKPVGHFFFTAGGHVPLGITRNPPDFESLSSDPDPDASRCKACIVLISPCVARATSQCSKQWLHCPHRLAAQTVFRSARRLAGNSEAPGVAVIQPPTAIIEAARCAHPALN